MSRDNRTRRNNTVSPPEGPMMTSALFPLTDLLEEVVHQEEVLWRKSELLLQSLRHGPAGSHTVLGNGVTNGDVVSERSYTSEYTEDEQARLYLIRYGRLTGVIHRFFQRLEKRHACLYLTGRKAKYESMRPVEIHKTSGSDDDPPLEVQSAGILAREMGRQLVILRDEELLVYRCALMCAQFPMLSAPCPPDGHSPTPTLPTLPLTFATNSSDLSRTAPAEYNLSTAAAASGITGDPKRDSQSLTNLKPPGEGDGLKQPPSSSLFTARITPRGNVATTVEVEIHPTLSRTPQEDNGRRRNLESPPPPADAPELQSMWPSGPKQPTSDPIPILGASKSKGKKSLSIRDQEKEEEGSGRFAEPKKQSKQIPADVLISFDSGDESEIIELTSSRSDSSNRLGREHPFTPMVNREMLCNLVRRSFNQTEEQQLQFDQILRHEYGRRSKGEILAKELAGQIQVLDNNAHPFYKPKLFVTRNGYDQWLQAEKQRVRSLIDKFWHFSLPRPQLWRHYNPTDYHRAYIILLQKVICCESRTDRKEPVHAGRTPSSPLSPTAQRLLTEFGLRYGVGELYRKIIYLDYLARHFDYEIWYIQHCTEELRAIRNLLPRNRNKITAVRREMELLRSTVHLLHGQTDNSLTRIERLFLDTDPREGVACLIELLSEVLDAEQSLFGKKVRPVEDWLKRYLKSGFNLRYERRKEIASDETLQSRTAQPFVLTPALVNALLLSIRDEVHEYKEKFQPVFRPYFDIVPFSKVEFYRLLCTDACSLCARMIHRPETRQSLSLEMLGLMYRLNERDSEWENVISPDLQLWRRHFVDLALVWMDVLSKQINQWIRQAVAKDQWTLLTFASNLTRRDHRTPHSSPLNVPTHILGVTASVRHSPFPSPSNTSRDIGSLMPGSLGKKGAFLPYHRIVVKRHNNVKSVSSESSGAVSDISSSSSVSMESGTSIHSSLGPIGEIPEVLLKGVKVARFGEEGDERMGDEEELLLSYSTTEPAQEIVVTALVHEDPLHEDPLHEEQPAGDVSTTEAVQLPNEEVPTPGQMVGGTDRKPTTAANGLPVAHSDKGISAVVNDTETLETHDHQKGSIPKDVPVPRRGILSESHVTQDTTLEPHLPPARDQPRRHITLPKMEVVRERVRKPKSHVPPEQPLHKKADNRSSDYLSVSIETADPKLPIPETRPVVRFGNMLDGCASAGSGEDEGGVVKPKPLGGSNWKRNPDTRQRTGTDEFHIPPASVHTVPELAKWVKEHPRSSLQYGLSTSMASSYVGTRQMEDSETTTTSQSSEETPSILENETTSYMFPVSNSPLDIITMLTRLASFTGVLLQILTPNLRHNVFPMNDPKATHEYSSEVAMARQQATQQWKLAEDMKTEFLKKLHKAMVNCLKLYADNLLCMDLCCWPGGEASRLLGQQMIHHLRRRKEMGEIWGCRHMVEAKHGLHPNGLPCQKKSSLKFESITRDMCIRINNIHTLITIFASLESHLYSNTRTEVHKPISAFGYVSSDPHDPFSPSYHRTEAMRPNPHRARPPVNEGTEFLVPSDAQSQTPEKTSRRSSMSTGLGPMEPDEGRERRKDVRPDVGFRSRESLQVLAYLRTIQNYQLRLLCLRMNKFFKPALSLLLDLRLKDCKIDKRLYPLITFLSRHRNALRKYIYPECFNTIMQYLWECIIQDLEEEVVKLRTRKRPVTDRAQMLLQTLSHLIEFMHDRGNGLTLDMLTSTSEYLLALLDIMTRSTDQLISIFNKLSAPQFARSRLDMSRAPIAIDTTVLHALRTQLHAYKKCFSGKEFVDRIIEMGRECQLQPESEANTPIPQEENQEDPGISTQVISPTGQVIVYTVHYATEVAQYLLNERILLSLPDLSSGTLTPPLSSSEEDEDEDDRGGKERSLETSTERARAVGTSRRLHLRGAGVMSSESPQISRAMPNSFVSDRGGSAEFHAFSYSSHIFYKFADVEDFESQSLYQSQVLVASTLQRQPNGANGGDEHLKFHRARSGTQYLVYDLLQQRAHKERRAKQFLQLPRTIAAATQRRQSDTNCDEIFRM